MSIRALSGQCKPSGTRNGYSIGMMMAKMNGAWVFIQPSRRRGRCRPHADRADDEGGQRANDDHAEERHEDQLDAFRDDPLQSVVDESKHGGHEQRHEHVAGIVAQCLRQTEYVGHARLGAQSGVLHARGGLGVHQAGELRGHEHGHDGTTQPWVDFELLGRVVGDHDRQEVEYALPDGFHEYPACGNLSFGMTFSEISRLTSAMMMEAPSSTPRIGRKESERYSKKESSQATLPRAWNGLRP